MKVLLLTQFYWPEARTAPTNLAAMVEDLQAVGNEVLVVTGFPNHPRGRIYDGYKMRLWQWDDVRGVRTLRLPLYPHHGLSAWKRMLNYGSFALTSTILGTYLSRRFEPDVLFVYFAPLTIAAPTAVFKWLHRVPAVYWVTDLWPENFRAAGVRLGDRMYKAVRRVEDWGYRQASAICIDSPGFESNLIGKGVPGEKIHLVSGWADESLFFPVAPDEDLARQFGLAGKFNIVYGGNLGTVQHLSTVVETAKLVQDMDGVQFVFIGDGSDARRLKQLVTRYQLPNVLFIPHQPMDQIRNFFALADALLIHLKKEPIFELQMPSKIVAYLACGRPILCAVPGVVEAIVRDAQAGLCCPSEDPPALAERVRLLHAMSAKERRAMGMRGRQAYLSNYTRAIQVKRIGQILQDVVELC